MEVEIVGLNKNPSNLSNEGEHETIRGNKRKNHRGGQKKKGRKGAKAGDQDTAAGSKGNGAMMEDRGDAVRMDAGEGSNATQELSKLYEVKAAAGKGLGVFAVRDIKCGTRIMCERPLIYFTQENVMELPAEFVKLSPDSQALFLSLHCQRHSALDAARTSIIRTQPILRPSTAALSIEELVKIMAIFDTNAFQAKKGSVICPQASRLNHSCLPNVHHCWNNSIGRITVHAVRDIAAGEEILTTYVKICLDHAERRKQLDRYGFACDCPACDTATAFGRASAKRRKRLFYIDQGLAMHSTLPILSPFSNDKKALCAVLEYAKLLHEEGLENMELTRNYREAASFSANSGNMRAACIWAQKALEMTANCAGTDFEGYKDDQKTLQDFVARRDRGRRMR